MKKGINKAVTYVLLSFSVVYLFITLSYVFFLPKLNTPTVRNQSGYSKAHQAGVYSNEDSNRLLWLHRVYKSIAEKKRASIVPQLSVLVFFGLFLLGSLYVPAAFNRSVKTGRELLFRRRYFYLNHCPLRV